MAPSRSAHVDTFCRDNLPSAAECPEFLDVPGVRYPERLNCAVELADATAARLGPGRPCLRAPGGELWTYGDLRRVSDQIARVLVEDHGVVPGNRVLLRGPNTPWQVACWFGVVKAGAVAVSTMPLLRSGELAGIAGIAALDIALCDARYVDELRAAGIDGLRIVEYGGADGLTAAAARKPAAFTAVDTAADDIVLLGFTSGTTGRPKATMHTHRDVLAIADTFSAHILRPEPDDVFTGTPPLAFTFGLGGLVVFPLRAGASVLLVEKATPDELMDHIAAHAVTVCITAPTAYRAMLGAGRLDRLATLRRGVAAGEHLPAATWHAIHDATGITLIDGIGATEMLHIFISAADDDIRPGATGRAVPGYRAKVVGDDGAELPPGTPGRLAVQGPTGCRYLADPRQAAYVRDGWNLTGDTFVEDADGYFWYQARNDDMIVSSGYNIAGPEVEEALLAHPDVAECAVVGVPDEARGQVVSAYAVLRDGVAGDDDKAAELQEFVKRRIAPYKYPRRVIFRRDLPKTASGKLQRARLRDETARPDGALRIAVIGGGPGGLYFAALAKQLGPQHEITVWERNAADDTFGFGVVFSDETLGGIEHADPEVHRRMQREFARWDDIDVHFRGRTTTSGGHGFAAMGRKRLMRILQDRCADLGVATHFRTEAPGVEALRETHDLVVAADGLNSVVRSTYADRFRPDLERRDCKYMWLGTDKVFDAFKFFIRETPYGVMQVHGYPFDAHGSTFIIEMNEEVWRTAGFDALAARELAPGESDLKSIELVRELFADVLDGHELMANNSKWINFTTVRNENWRHGNVVLLGDAAHTAHFSIGSGTKLAMEDALALAACLHEHETLDTALTEYEAERTAIVVSTQRAAQASLEWFENLGQYTDQDPYQFAFNIMTRSRRVTYENLQLRDPEFVAEVNAWFARANAGAADTPPMFQPFRIGGLDLVNRVMVSAMDMYRAVDGMPNDFHLTHLGGKALGGAGLVMTEMVCVSPTGRITPGCTGIWSDDQAREWRRLTDFVHRESAAKIAIQIGHSGRKGSTRLMWDGIDQPLDDGNWEVVAPSALPYKPGVNQVPRELTADDLAEITGQFVAAARRADDAGFDLLELHCAHGYLLSSFISPVTNRRTDAYGGDLRGRLRYPLEVFAAMRAVWPAHKPMTVRISATDWVDDGIAEDDAITIATAFKEAGAAAIDVSTGQVTPDETPAFGRSYQTPFADRIRNRAGIPTIAVGVISSYDDVNSIILAGRADICALGRAHLYDPNWTLHAAVEQDYDGPGAVWPDPWKAGRRKPQTGRSDGPKPRLQLVREGAQGTRHARWRPNGEETR